LYCKLNYEYNVINFLSLYYVVILVELSCFTRTVFFRHVFAFIRFISRILSRFDGCIFAFIRFVSRILSRFNGMARARCIFVFIRFISHISSRFNGVCPLHFCFHSLYMSYFVALQWLVPAAFLLTFA